MRPLQILMTEHRNPFRNFAFFITIATSVVVALTFAAYLLIRVILG